MDNNNQQPQVTISLKKYLNLLWGTREYAFTSGEDAKIITETKGYEQLCVVSPPSNPNQNVVFTVFELKAFNNSYAQIRERKKQSIIQRKINCNLTERISIISKAMISKLNLSSIAPIETIVRDLADKENKDIGPLLKIYGIDMNNLPEKLSLKEATFEVEHEISEELKKLQPADNNEFIISSSEIIFNLRNKI